VLCARSFGSTSRIEDVEMRWLRGNSQLHFSEFDLPQHSVRALSGVPGDCSVVNYMGQVGQVLN